MTPPKTPTKNQNQNLNNTPKNSSYTPSKSSVIKTSSLILNSPQFKQTASILSAQYFLPEEIVQNIITTESIESQLIPASTHVSLVEEAEKKSKKIKLKKKELKDESRDVIYKSSQLNFYLVRSKASRFSLRATDNVYDFAPMEAYLKSLSTKCIAYAKYKFSVNWNYLACNNRLRTKNNLVTFQNRKLILSTRVLPYLFSNVGDYDIWNERFIKHRAETMFRDMFFGSNKDSTYDKCMGMLEIIEFVESNPHFFKKGVFKADVEAKAATDLSPETLKAFGNINLTGLILRVYCMTQLDSVNSMQFITDNGPGIDYPNEGGFWKESKYSVLDIHKAYKLLLPFGSITQAFLAMGAENVVSLLLWRFLLGKKTIPEYELMGFFRDADDDQEVLNEELEIALIYIWVAENNSSTYKLSGDTGSIIRLLYFISPVSDMPLGSNFNPELSEYPQEDDYKHTMFNYRAHNLELLNYYKSQNNSNIIII